MKSIDEYIIEIKKTPNNSELFRSRGYEYQRKGDYARAIKDYKESIRIDPSENSTARFLLEEAIKASKNI